MEAAEPTPRRRGPGRGVERWPAKRSLKTARRFAHLTLKTLAEQSFCTIGTIWDLENDRNKHPSHEKVTNIVAALRRYPGLRRLKASDLFPVRGLVNVD